jgi:hypothetical protein
MGTRQVRPARRSVARARLAESFREPTAVFPSLAASPASRVREFLPGVASLLLHGLLLVLLAILLEPRDQHKGDADQDRRAADTREVQMVYLPPPKVSTPLPRVTPQEATPPGTPLTPGPDQTPGSRARKTPDPEPSPDAPPEAQRQLATRPDPGDADQESKAPKATKAEAAREAEKRAKSAASTLAPHTTLSASTPTLESEAKRIFGRPTAKPGPTSGERDARPWETPLDWASRGCTIGRGASDSTVPAGMGVVQGRVFRQDNGKPLVGAHLQILGTPYHAYTDNTGYYKLMFDASLVDRCRTQSVRVWAPGYQSRDLTLYAGVPTSSDVPLQKN